MATWLETCAKQLTRLEKASVLSDKLITLSNKMYLNHGFVIPKFEK